MSSLLSKWRVWGIGVVLCVGAVGIAQAKDKPNFKYLTASCHKKKPCKWRPDGNKVVLSKATEIEMSVRTEDLALQEFYLEPVAKAKGTRCVFSARATSRHQPNNYQDRQTCKAGTYRVVYKAVPRACGQWGNPCGPGSNKPNPNLNIDLVWMLNKK